ncbi:DUF397 domain-containing protein [Streptomyces sp. W16]|uniref:DUF397 domain-containing protein n=1 Tax=Streptomyces sp. W16 TaxID=3076631 RepID=UPI00295B0091|nr:DUF397 domain-containing protein [Streptomyces sp. W16]MDV9170580.1 DUF397 domain-containing protein [Streptomyces sp. W16]
MIRNAPAGDAFELVWFKSSYSDSNNPNDCVEVATAPGTMHVRDSKHTQGPRFAVTAAAWTEFLQLVEEA